MRAPPRGLSHACGKRQTSRIGQGALVEEQGVRVKFGSFLRECLPAECLTPERELILRDFRGTIIALLQELARSHPELGEHLHNDEGEPEPHLLIAVNKQLVAKGAGASTLLNPGDLVEIHLVIAGG